MHLQTKETVNNKKSTRVCQVLKLQALKQLSLTYLQIKDYCYLTLLTFYNKADREYWWRRLSATVAMLAAVFNHYLSGIPVHLQKHHVNSDSERMYSCFLIIIILFYR